MPGVKREILFSCFFLDVWNTEFCISYSSLLAVFFCSVPKYGMSRDSLNFLGQ